VIRWALRPVDDRNLMLSLRREDDKVKIVVDALDKDDRFVNFLQFQGIAVSPEVDADGMPKKIPVTMVQTAPGRYEGVVENAQSKGNYFVSLGYVGPDGKTGLISGGVSVPYSDEYRELKSNEASLEGLAQTTGGNIWSWQLRNDRRTVDVARTVQSADVFRRDPKITPPESMQPLWPALLFLASFLFLGDVAVRRLAPDVARWRRAVSDALQKLRGRDSTAVEETIEKLRSRKVEVNEQLARARTAAQFEAPPPAAARDGAGADVPLKPQVAKKRSNQSTPVSPPAPQTSGASYAERLLKAKQKVWDERNKKPEE
jgi:hypothetical protein